MDSKKHMSHKEARQIIRIISKQFNLTTYKEWMQFIGRELRCNGKSMLSFEQARKFAHSLNLKSAKEWSDYCLKFECPPNNIPSYPPKHYKNKGWVSWDDFLSAKKSVPRKFLDYETAKCFVHHIKPKINNCKEWDRYCKSAKKPKNIPHSPQKIYKDHGWMGWDVFFGSGMYSPGMSNEEIQWDVTIGKCHAGEVVDALRGDMTDEEIIEAHVQEAPEIIEALKKHMEKYPEKYPTDMEEYSMDEEKKVLGKFRPFDEARDYVCTLELQNFKEWKEFCDLEDRPKDIPHSPHKIYKKEWMGWNYFLGIGLYRQQFYIEVPYSEVREVIENEIKWDINNIGGMIESFREEFDTDEEILKEYKDEPKLFIDGLKKYLKDHPREEGE